MNQPSVSAERDHGEIAELKQLVGLGWKDGELVKGIFLLVSSAGIDAVHGDDNVIPVYSRRGSRGIKHGYIGRRAGHD